MPIKSAVASVDEGYLIMVAAKAVKKVAISAAEVMAIKTTEAGSTVGSAVAAVVVVVVVAVVVSAGVEVVTGLQISESISSARGFSKKFSALFQSCRGSAQSIRAGNSSASIGTKSLQTNKGPSGELGLLPKSGKKIPPSW